MTEYGELLWNRETLFAKMLMAKPGLEQYLLRTLIVEEMVHRAHFLVAPFSFKRSGARWLRLDKWEKTTANLVRDAYRSTSHPSNLGEEYLRMLVQVRNGFPITEEFYRDTRKLRAVLLQPQSPEVEAAVKKVSEMLLHGRAPALSSGAAEARDEDTLFAESRDGRDSRRSTDFQARESQRAFGDITAADLGEVDAEGHIGAPIETKKGQRGTLTGVGKKAVQFRRADGRTDSALINDARITAPKAEASARRSWGDVTKADVGTRVEAKDGRRGTVVEVGDVVVKFRASDGKLTATKKSTARIVQAETQLSNPAQKGQISESNEPARGTNTGSQRDGSAKGKPGDRADGQRSLKGSDPIGESQGAWDSRARGLVEQARAKFAPIVTETNQSQPPPRAWGDIRPSDHGAIVERRGGRRGTIYEVGKGAVAARGADGNAFGIQRADARIIGRPGAPSLQQTAQRRARPAVGIPIRAADRATDRKAGPDLAPAPGGGDGSYGAGSARREATWYERVSGLKFPFSPKVQLMVDYLVKNKEREEKALAELKEEIEAARARHWKLMPKFFVKMASRRFEERRVAIEKKAIDLARALVSVHPRNRGRVRIKGQLPPHLKKITEEGSKIVEAYTHAKLLPAIEVRDLPPDDFRAKHDGGKILLEPATLASVVAHEITHATERQNSEVEAAMLAFLRLRTKGESPVKITEYTDSKEYREDELVWLDHWRRLGGDPYCGKKCDRGTELLTMGIQRLHKDPLAFAESDPEYFSVVVETLRKW